MNKKAQFAMMHPGMLFILGLIIGAAIVYFLAMKGMLPNLPVP